MLACVLRTVVPRPSTAHLPPPTSLLQLHPRILILKPSSDVLRNFFLPYLLFPFCILLNPESKPSSSNLHFRYTNPSPDIYLNFCPPWVIFNRSTTSLLSAPVSFWMGRHNGTPVFLAPRLGRTSSSIGLSTAAGEIPSRAELLKRHLNGLFCLRVTKD